jgi:hypothetical protein
MRLTEAKEWVKSFLPKDETYEAASLNVDCCTGYSALLHEIDERFYISENDANAIFEFMNNKGIKLNRY